MRRSDWLLLAVCAARGKGLSPVRLQKSLYLLRRELTSVVGDSFYDFSAYHYGPFSRAVYDDAEQLAKEGLLAITQKPGENWSTYIATDEGCERASELRSRAPKAAEYLDSVVNWALRQSFQQLVRAIYVKYPETRANSVFRG